MVATTTWKWLRVNDRLVRVGGKEFVVLLPTTTLEEGAVAAERVRAAIASTSITTGTETLAMTVSVGVARHVIGAAHGDFIEAARTAMLDAKQRGRNQVVLSSSTEH
jgi:diguanylate cyclase (GGDEF)-like protein